MKSAIALATAACIWFTSLCGAAEIPAPPAKRFPTTQGPASVVQRQLEAYNRHDLAGFMATYHKDAQLFRMPATQPTLSGAQALSRFYARSRFNIPALRGEILARDVLGNKVIDHERLFGLTEQPVEAVVVYSVVDGLIATVWIFSPD